MTKCFRKKILLLIFLDFSVVPKRLKDRRNLDLGMYNAHYFYKKNDAIGFLPTIPMPLFCLQKNGPKGEQITYFNFNINIM